MSRERRFRVAVRRFDPFESAIRKQWQAFEESERTGLELEAEPFDLHPLSETLFEREGMRRGDWDVAFLNTDWVALVHDTGAALDLAPHIRRNPPEGYPEAWPPSLLRLQQFGDTILGLPYHDGPECLIYRRDLFEDPAEQGAYRRRFGAPLQVPKTWDEFQRTARFFCRPERNLHGTVFAAFPDGHNTVYDFCLQLWTRGGELFDGSGALRLNTPEAARALEYYRAILNDGSAVHPRSRELDSVASGLAFAAGEVAMMVNWFGFGSMAETIADSRVKGKVGIAPIPSDPGAPSTSLNIYWILSVAAGSPHAETAYRFVRHCAGAAMDKLLTLEGAIGCRKSTWSDPEVNAEVPFYHRLDEIHARARELPRLVHWPKVAKTIDQLVLAAMNTDRPAPELLREAQSGLD